MVVFNCNACGESLKKNQVEKHYQTVCRRCEVLSCVDCGKDFWGEDYKEHIKCISEEEKYSGKNYKPKANANKGEAKQEAWIEKVQNAIDKANPAPRLKDILERIKEYPNIPRKKPKFENFLGNSLRVRDRNLSSQVWDLLMTNLEQDEKEATEEITKDSISSVEDSNGEKSSDKTEMSENNNNSLENPKKLSKRERKEERRKKTNKKEKKDSQNGDKFVSETGEITHSISEPEINGQKMKKKKKKKRKAEEDLKVIPEKKSKKRSREDPVEENNDTSQNSETTQEDDEPSNKKQKTNLKFNWEEIIYAVLKKKDEQEISVKRLKKKVIAEYCASGAHVTSEEKLWAKFDKKIKKNPNLRVLKDRVKLVMKT